jgi:hypothetical protein
MTGRRQSDRRKTWRTLSNCNKFNDYKILWIEWKKGRSITNFARLLLVIAFLLLLRIWLFHCWFVECGVNKWQVSETRGKTNKRVFFPKTPEKSYNSEIVTVVCIWAPIICICMNSVLYSYEFRIFVSFNYLYFKWALLRTHITIKTFRTHISSYIYMPRCGTIKSLPWYCQTCDKRIIGSSKST